MNYLKLEIREDSETQALILSHDFKLEAFQMVIDQIITNLKERGTLLTSDVCKASLTPQFTGVSRYEAESISTDPSEVDLACQQVDWEKANSSYALHFDEIAIPDQPVASWLLTIHPMSHRILYRRSLPLTALDQYVSDVKSALHRSRRLRPHVPTSYRVFACDDEKGEFLSLTALGLPAKGEGGIELLAPESVAHPKASKSEYLKRAKQVIVGKTVGDIPLFVRRSALDEVDKHINQYPARESGGVLIGQVFEDTESGESFVEIAHAIPARRAEADAVSLRFTTETWQEINAEKRKNFPDQLTVGWYHSHLVTKRLLDQNGKVSYTDLFFSKDDHFFHKNFFKEPWHVALVVSPRHQQPAFFQWRSESDGARQVTVCGSYYILEENTADELSGDKS